MRFVAPAISVLIFVGLIIAYRRKWASGKALGVLAAIVTTATAVFIFSDALFNSPETDDGTSANQTGLVTAPTLGSTTQESTGITPSLTMAPTNGETSTPSPMPTETPTPFATATLTDEETVVRMVRQYYEFIQAGMGEAAYALLHPELRKSPGFFPYEQWESTVANVEYEFLGDFPRYVEVRGNQARVDFSVSWEKSEKLPETRNHTFCFTFVVSERWYIRHIHFVFSDCFGLMNPTPDPTP